MAEERPVQSQVEPSRIPMSELLAFHAARNSASLAVTCDDISLTFGELDLRTNRKARQLAALGVDEGDVVTVAVPNGLEFYEIAFAIWKLGAIPNFVSSKLPAAELRAIVELAKPRLIVGEAGAEIEGWAYLSTRSDPSQDTLSDPLPTKVSPRWKIMASGGSTGRPKLIVTNQPSLYDPASSFLHRMPGDTLLNPGPLYHNAPFVFAFGTIFTGGHVVEMGKFEPLRALELIERFKVNWVNFVPTMMSRIWKLPSEQRLSFDLSSLRAVWHMASICPPWLKQAWIDWIGAERIFEMYGGTEVLGNTTITGSEWLAHKGSVGRVSPGSRMRILDDQGQERPTGEIGGIYFLPDTGPNSTYKYIGAEATSIGDWQTYGDLGYVDDEGFLYIADRRTDLILSGGSNIYPAEVEAALDQHPDVRSSIVIGLPDEDLGQRVHALVQVSDEARARTDADALRGFLSDRLVRYKIPRTFEFTSEYLRDDAGKARRSQLREARTADV